MDMRPVYWMLCGASATLLTSAWGSRVAILPQPAHQTSDLSSSFRLESNTQQKPEQLELLANRQAWKKAKSNPFVLLEAAAPKQSVVEKIVVPSPVPVFPYTYVGRLWSEEQNLVFLSQNGQVHGVKEGDILNGTYRIDHMGENALELTYLPGQRIMTFFIGAGGGQSQIPASDVSAEETARPAVPEISQQVGMIASGVNTRRLE